jgi:NitT/TauT family transport system ATP-binding protein
MPAPTANGTGPKAATLLAVEGLVKRYDSRLGDRLVLDGVDLQVTRGQFLCIVGPSGAGKTTLLRCMAGLTQPTAGRTLLDGTTITKPPAALAVVFQDYGRSLMPWLSVRSNVELPLASRRTPRAERHRRADEALEAVGLSDSANLHPWQLSGGMQQRVAIARALAYRPEALLMDEPFASVDAQTRADLEDLTLSVRNTFGMTVILVTHDIDEAVYLGDQVIVLSGSPARVRARIDIDLGVPRDQISTKSLPEFARLRGQVLQLIRADRAATEAAH